MSIIKVQHTKDNFSALKHQFLVNGNTIFEWDEIQNPEEIETVYDKTIELDMTPKYSKGDSIYYMRNNKLVISRVISVLHMLRKKNMSGKDMLFNFKEYFSINKTIEDLAQEDICVFYYVSNNGITEIISQEDLLELDK